VTAVLDAATRGLVRVALAMPHTSENELGDWMRRAREDGTPSFFASAIASVR